MFFVWFLSFKPCRLVPVQEVVRLVHKGNHEIMARSFLIGKNTCGGVLKPARPKILESLMASPTVTRVYMVLGGGSLIPRHNIAD